MIEKVGATQPTLLDDSQAPTEYGLPALADFTYLTAKKRRFLNAMARMATITHAARAAGVTRQTVYNWQDTDRRFGELFDLAKEVAADRLEAEVYRRAFEGVREPVIYRGRVVKDSCGKDLFITRHSDTLAIFLLKAMRPKKYRERFEVGNTDGKAFVIRSAEAATPEKWDQHFHQELHPSDQETDDDVP